MPILWVSIGSTRSNIKIIGTGTTTSLIKGHGTYENMARISN